MSKLLKLMAFALMVNTNCFAQNSSPFKVMFYNLLGYPNNNCLPNRENYLKVIVEEIMPDILMVCELNDFGGVNTILQSALNANGANTYKAANYVPNGSSNNDLQNMIFYDSTKFALVEQNQIYTGLRDINHYRVYAIDSGLAFHNDTLFLNLYVGHLKAGSSGDNLRKQAVDSLNSWIQDRSFPASEAHLLAADLNVYTCSEPAYQCLLDSFPCDFEDPIQACGSWHNNPAYETIHTQSTRCVQFCGGASGGIDDRFDQILVSKNMINNISPYQADSSSYEAFGNSGLFNSCLESPWSHSYLSPRVISALYYMSDHFPVVMNVEASFPPIPVGIGSTHAPTWQISVQNPVQDQLRVFLTEENPGSLDWAILTIWGTVAKKGKWDFTSKENQMRIPVEDMAEGTYYFRFGDNVNDRSASRLFQISR